MLQTFQSILELSDEATAKMDAYDLTDHNGAPVGGADADVKGFALSPADAGMAFANVVIGTVRIKASGAIAKGDKLVTVDAKTVRTAVEADNNPFATALTTAGDGEFLDILIK